METILMNTENIKANERHEFRLSLANKLNLKDPSKNMAKEDERQEIYIPSEKNCKFLMT